MTRKFSLTPYLFLAPALLVIAVFVLYPIVAVVRYSFTDYDIVTAPQWIGLQNYQKLLKDATFWLALRHSLIYLVVTPTLIVLSIILAIIVNRKLRGIQLFRALYYLPAVSGSIAVGITWRWLFDTQGGLLNGLLIWLGVLKEPMQWLSEPSLTLLIAMLLTTWMGVGYYMVIFLAGLQNIPEELYDAALIDGCNNLQKHWYVSLPGLRLQITLVAVISSLAALKVFDEIYVLTLRSGGVLDSGVTMVFYLWRQAFQLSHAGYASAIALVLLLVTLAFSVVNIRLQETRSETD
jgi:putative chitobiose transport system permease protein